MPETLRIPLPSMSARFASPVLAVALASCLGLSLAASVRAEVGGEILGTVGDTEIGLEEVRRSLATLTLEEREALRTEPAALGQYVRALLVQQLVLREALEAGWDKSVVVAERMSLLREGVIANTYLESQAEAPSDYPGEDELAAAYAANRDSFLQPKSWHLAQIFVSAPKAAEGDPDPPAALAKMERLRAALASSGTDFGALASAESEEPMSAARQGEIGWLPEPQIHPGIRAVLPGMKLGEVSDPVRLEGGWHFIKVLDIVEPRIPTLEQIREPLAQRMRAERAQAETEAFLGRLLRDHPIAINEMVLSKLLPATE